MTTEHMFIFDGDCGFCSRFVWLLLATDEEKFYFLPLRSPAAAQLLQRHGVAVAGSRSSYVLTRQGRLLSKAEAILFALEEVGWRPRLVALARRCPRVLADRLYEVVALLRRHLLARSARCPVPTARQAARLLDGAR